MIKDTSTIPVTGDPCPDPKCDGWLRVQNSKATSDGRFVKQYFACWKCLAKPKKSQRVIPSEYVSRRGRRS